VKLFEFAPAKINLALHVRRREADGYHVLETMFVFADVGDTVGWEGDEDGVSLAVDGPFAGGLAGEGDNLVLRAARALAEAAGVRRGAALRLTKRLPVASGMGGGSADAAATLRLLNSIWELGFPRAKLAEIGAELGADVPACVHAVPLRGDGRGERLVPIAFEGSWAVLANPGTAVSTRAVFAAWDGVDRGALVPGDGMAAALAGRNDLEPTAMLLAPVIGDVLAQLRVQPGARLVRMSGSGATCFALFATPEAARLAAVAIAVRAPGWWVEACRLAET
jgi:4-diphosphocytidyl-2-C-methyl-D-erythritol kinase